MIAFSKPYYGSISEKLITKISKDEKGYYAHSYSNKYVISQKDYEYLKGKYNYGNK